MVSSQYILVRSTQCQPVVDYVHLDHLVKVVPARFLHSRIKVFSFAISTYFRRGTFQCKYCASPQTFTLNFRTHRWSFPAVICCGVLMVISYFLHYFFFLIYYLGSFSQEELSLLHLYIDSNAYCYQNCLWIFIEFYGLYSNSIFFFPFVNCSGFDHWESFQFGSSALSTCRTLCFRALPLILPLQEVSDSRGTFSVPGLQPTKSPRKPCFLLWGHGVKDPGPCGSMCALFLGCHS